MIETLDRPLVPEEGGISPRPTIRRCFPPSDDQRSPCSFPILASNGFCVEGDQRSSSRKPVEISLRPPLVDPNPAVWLNSSLRGIMSTLPKRTVRTAKPYDVLLKLNFGEGCSCVCTQIKFTVDFQRNDSTRVGFCISDDMFYGGQNERRNAEYRNI
ncbi:uncharacterized protein LOC127794303 isoform X2 [Diospyros lotus]|uniref:uncharacterized protein LOC127794303 isoform X2 n=1 Tax=Diospyros lotus TaxID=55363 RepID=UPI00225B6A23|nr:uncharacterized protein LOC127794303 isoform X2 [Diospyros lotus]XP_052181244.1 uncharacterized protein LOC127794303 isoform X2 [Diospyros lotus]